MRREFGYSQMRFNYITDYANSIAEHAIQMEMAWNNSENFKDEVNLQVWLENKAETIEQEMKEMSAYLKPMDNGRM